MREIVFAPAARAEFQAAAEWYESRQGGLGEQFVAAVDAAIRLVGEEPMACAVWDRDARFRRIVTGRVPYVVFYRVQGETIEVAAVAHGSREPGYWLRRQ
jgi:plasmid stabilization system protein ParE